MVKLLLGVFLGSLLAFAAGIAAILWGLTRRPW